MITKDLKERKHEAIAQAVSVLKWFEKHDVCLPNSINFYATSIEAGCYVLESEGGRSVMTDLIKTCLLDNIKVYKHYADSSFALSFEIEGVKVRFSCERSLVCERKVIGTKTIPAVVLPEHTEEIIEWECKDSLLRSDE